MHRSADDLPDYVVDTTGQHRSLRVILAVDGSLVAMALLAMLVFGPRHEEQGTQQRVSFSKSKTSNGDEIGAWDHGAVYGCTGRDRDGQHHPATPDNVFLDHAPSRRNAFRQI